MTDDLDRLKEAERNLEELRLHYHELLRDKAKDEARLRAAKEVVKGARGYVEGWDATTVGLKPWPTKLREAIRRYDEAVGRVKEE